MGDRNRVGIGLSNRTDRLRRLAKSIPGLLKSLKSSVSEIGNFTLKTLEMGYNPESRLRYKIFCRFFHARNLWLTLEKIAHLERRYCNYEKFKRIMT
jgi:hypothetical protein